MNCVKEAEERGHNPRVGEDRLTGLATRDQDLAQREAEGQHGGHVTRGQTLGPAHHLRQDVVTVAEDRVEDPRLRVVVPGAELELQQRHHLLQLRRHSQDVVIAPGGEEGF